ncbi:lipopolysaccharide biosynthesis protein [Aeromonas veronii]
MKILKENALLKSLMSTFLAKICVSFGGVCLSWLIGNYYGMSILGDFFIFQMAVVTVSVILTLGMNETLVLFSSKYIDEFNVSYLLLYALLLSGTLLFLFSAFIYIYPFSTVLVDKYSIIFNNKVFFLVSVTSCLINLLLSGFMRGVKKPAYSVLLENGVVSIICIVIILSSRALDIDIVHSFAVVYGLSTSIVSLIGLLNLKNEIPKTLIKPNGVLFSLFLGKNWSFYIMVLCGLVSTSLISLYLGYVLDPKDVAIFRVMQQICVFISFSLIILNAVMPAYITGLFKENSISNLEKISVLTSKYAMLLSLPIYIIFLFYPNEIMSIFGKEVIIPPYLLLILASASFFNVSTGSVASILKMCGFEKVLTKTMIFSNIIGLITLYILTPIYGLMGAVISASIIIIIQNAASLYFAKSRLGVAAAFYVVRG